MVDVKEYERALFMLAEELGVVGIQLLIPVRWRVREILILRERIHKLCLVIAEEVFILILADVVGAILAVGQLVYLRGRTAGKGKSHHNENQRKGGCSEETVFHVRTPIAARGGENYNFARKKGAFVVFLNDTPLLYKKTPRMSTRFCYFFVYIFSRAHSPRPQRSRPSSA